MKIYILFSEGNRQGVYAKKGEAQEAFDHMVSEYPALTHRVILYRAKPWCKQTAVDMVADGAWWDRQEVVMEHLADTRYWPRIA